MGVGTPREAEVEVGIGWGERTGAGVYCTFGICIGDGCSTALGSSGPSMLGLRWRLARGFVGRCVVASLLLLVILAGSDLSGLRWGFDTSECLMGEVGDAVGEGVFMRAFFAFILRSFSSSSDDVASESLPLRLIAPELRFEAVPNDGARLRPWPYATEPAKDSVRLIRCMRGSMVGMMNESDEFDMSDMDLRRRGIRELDWLELRVVELGVEGKNVCPLGVR